ncbi:MAG: metallophosphoesterase [Candidatus Aminicenantes bacterium]|nr:metallophosphoesterase [Candidatus Aminicenantes bacterium]
MARSGRPRTGAALIAGLLLILPSSRAKVPDDAAITFGVVADCQFAAAMPDGDRFFSRSRQKLSRAIDFFNRRGVRFVVHLGDLIDRQWSSYDLILPFFKKSAAPVYFVLGNHEFDVDAADKLRVRERLGVGVGYRAFTEGDWKFVLLNGNELSFNFPSDESVRKEAGELYGRMVSQKRPNAIQWNGGLGGKQMKFLVAELEQAERDGRRVIVCCHFPVYPPAAYNLWNDEDVVTLLERYPAVKAYFNGHNHAGAYAQKQGLHFVTFRGMVETGDTSAWAVVSLANDRILIDGFGREPRRVLKVR